MLWRVLSWPMFSLSGLPQRCRRLRRSTTVGFAPHVPPCEEHGGGTDKGYHYADKDARGERTRCGQHSDDYRKSATEHKGYGQKPHRPTRSFGFRVLTLASSRLIVEMAHDAQHDKAATSLVNDWAVSLMASAMVRYGVQAVASCSTVRLPSSA